MPEESFLDKTCIHCESFIEVEGQLVCKYRQIGDEIKNYDREKRICANFEERKTPLPEKTILKKQKIIWLPETITWKDCKKIITNKWLNENKMVAYFSANFKSMGHISRINDLKENLEIFRHCLKVDKKTKEQEDFLIFLDEIIDGRRATIKDSLDKYFYPYTFVSNDRHYILFSEEKLPAGNYLVEGMEISARHVLQSLSRYQTPGVTKYVIAKSIKQIENVYSEKELQQLTFSKEQFLNWIFHSEEYNCIFRQYPQLETLVLAWLFSKIKTKPTHILRMGVPNTAKTTVSKLLSEKLENKPVIDLGSSTIKGLTPSFNSSPPSPGAILSATNFCFLDEIFKALRNDEEINREYFGRLNSLLDCSEVRFCSGQGNITGKSTAKVWANTNPIYGSSSLSLLIKHFEPSWLSRHFIFYDTKETIEWIEQKKGIKDINGLVKVEDWAKLYATLLKIQSEFDFTTLQLSVYEPIITAIGQYEPDTKEFLKIRLLEHLERILDGIIKTRAFFEKSFDFKANINDYKTLQELMGWVVKSWCVIPEKNIETMFNKIEGEKGKDIPPTTTTNTTTTTPIPKSFPPPIYEIYEEGLSAPCQDCGKRAFYLNKKTAKAYCKKCVEESVE